MRKLLQLLFVSLGKMAPEAHGCAAALKKPLPHGITPRKVVEEFMSSVNMSRQEIDAFLKSEESRRAVLWGEQTEHEGRHLARRSVLHSMAFNSSSQKVLVPF